VTWTCPLWLFRPTEQLFSRIFTGFKIFYFCPISNSPVVFLVYICLFSQKTKDYATKEYNYWYINHGKVLKRVFSLVAILEKKTGQSLEFEMAITLELQIFTNEGLKFLSLSALIDQQEMYNYEYWLKLSWHLLTCTCILLYQWPNRRGGLSWGYNVLVFYYISGLSFGGQFISILPSQCIWNLAC
jgi:hypothetical protein